MHQKFTNTLVQLNIVNACKHKYSQEKQKQQVLAQQKHKLKWKVYVICEGGIWLQVIP